MLKAELASTYKSRGVGSNSWEITEADWTKLSSAQKASYLSFVYNCGSFGNYPHIPTAIRNGDYQKASAGITKGPTHGSSGKFYKQLEERRNAEAQMMLKI